MTDVFCMCGVSQLGLDVELETNVIVEDGDHKRPYIDAGQIDTFDDNVIHAAGELTVFTIKPLQIKAFFERPYHQFAN